MKKILKRTVLIAIAFVVTFGTSWSSTVNAVGEACPELATEYSVDTRPQQIIRGSDDAMWFMGAYSNNTTKIGRIAVDGTTTLYSIPGTIRQLVKGPNNEIWASGFNNATASGIFGKILTDGSFVSLSLSNASARIGSFVLGPDGAFWGPGSVDSGTAGVVRITTEGAVTLYPVTGRPDTPNHGFYGFAAGPDNAIWFTAQGDGNQNRYVKIAKVNMADGAITWFDLDHRYDPEGSMGDFVAGPDGALWYTVQQNGESLIGRMATDGAVTEYRDPNFGSLLPDITFGSDGNIWFVNGSDGFGRVKIDPFEVDAYYTQTDLNNPGTISIAFGPNDTVWFGEVSAQKIGKMPIADVPNLDAPTGHQLVGDINIPDMQWDVVSGATSYKVCRDGIVIADITGTTYNDTAASIAIHHYTIVATNPSGRSAPNRGIEMNSDFATPTLTNLTLSKDPLPRGEQSTLSVDAHDDSGIINDVRYRVDGGQEAPLIRQYAGVDSTDTWAIIFLGGDGFCGAGCSPPGIPLEDGVHTIAVEAFDWVGKSSGIQTITITVGLVPPTNVSAVKSPTNTTPQLTWSAVGGATEYRIYRDGATTPITTTTATTYIDSTTLSDGNHTYTVSAADATTETAQSQPVSVMVDKTAPVASNITVNPALIVVAGNLNISANASDALSGVAGAEYFIDTDPGQGNAIPMTYNSGTGKVTATKNITFNSLSRGTHSVKVRVKDAAGNWSTLLSRNFVYL